MESGTQLGHYTILSALGKGGIGEVYRATDTRLDRTVANKDLPEAMAADPTTFGTGAGAGWLTESSGTVHLTAWTLLICEFERRHTVHDEPE